LVISNANPALPASNSFWCTFKDARWYIGTWLPAIYQLPASLEISAACEHVFRSSTTAIYTIDRNLADRLSLRRLNDQEIEVLGLS
jgi:hypothetical protein